MIWHEICLSKEKTRGIAMGSVSEPSPALSLLLLLLSMLLLLLLLLLMLLSLLIFLTLLLLILLFEAEVVLISAKDGWRGAIIAEKAIETRRNILRSLRRRFKSSFLLNPSSQVKADHGCEGMRENDWRGSQSVTGLMPNTRHWQ